MPMKATMTGFIFRQVPCGCPPSTAVVFVESKLGGCLHEDLYPLGCQSHDYLHTIGFGCHDCEELHAFTVGPFCEPGTESPVFEFEPKEAPGE